MPTKNWIIFATIIFAVTQEINSACVCNANGTDVCAGCREHSIVSPKNNARKTDIALPPIGDNCWCSKSLIEPASLPKPCPKPEKLTPCECESTKSSYNSSSIFSKSSTSYVVPQVNYVPSIVKDDSLAADPISISLAVQAGKAIEVPEAKLGYGFAQKPIDNLPKVLHSSIKEENLYALKNEVITLKKPSPTQMQLEEDYLEIDEEEIDSTIDEEGLPSLTYKQLGYITEQFKNPQFQEMIRDNSYEPAVVPKKLLVDCDFRPGRIVKYEHIKNCY